MSIHPSLSSLEKGKKSRSVLKRIERIRIMMSKNQWKEGDDIYGLPKYKTVRIKLKKEKKAEKAVETAAAEGATPASPEAKEQTAAKGPTTKSQEKK